MMRAGAPFVLCEDARPGGGSARLFTSPHETITATALDQIEPALQQVRAALRRGLHVAGWLSYEAGIAFERRLIDRAQRDEADRFPLLWFGVFDAPGMLSPAEVSRALPDAGGAWISAPRPRMSRAAYDEAFARTKDYIEAGDVYQINLSYRADLTLFGNPLGAYARVRGAGQGGWSGVVHCGETWLLSTSPELFFRMDHGVIEARPMKGTAKRRADPAQDRAAAAALAQDPKERAENVMIVDLLRNDISRLAKRGSVKVPQLFAVETYPTLHTLTSTVRADLRDEHDVIDVLRALFPCGSITGAPKIRAMEIISELETDKRGPYSGSIGWMAPDGSAEFNVAIRTLAVAGGRAEIGLGSAVVHDSTLKGEWEECRTKAAFVTANAPAFDLLETMGFELGAGLKNLDLHLSRLRRSMETFHAPFDETAIRSALASALANRARPCVVRLAVSLRGKIEITLREWPSTPAHAVDVALAPLPVAADDFRLRHKTSNRAFYDDARTALDVYEVIFTDPDGFLTEGSFTNLFVERDGLLLTPPASRGLLPGIQREILLAAGRAREADLRREDLASGFLVGNSVRGLIPARLSNELPKRGAA